MTCLLLQCRPNNDVTVTPYPELQICGILPLLREVLNASSVGREITV